jgi:hypothetical protein
MGNGRARFVASTTTTDFACVTTRTERFTGGIERDVFQDKDDRQFVVDDDGDKVYGYWVHMDDPDEPAIVDAE